MRTINRQLVQTFCGAVAALCGIAVPAPLAAAQATFTYVFRNGSAFVQAGSSEQGTYQQASPSYTTFTETHEDYPILLGNCSARFRLDSVPRAKSIDVHVLGQAGRSLLPPPLLSAASNGTDRWRFTIGQTVCFVLNARVHSSSTIASPSPSAFFNLGVYSGGTIQLASGSFTSVLSGSASGTATQTFTHTGTLAPGTYYFEVGQSCPGSGVFNCSTDAEVGLAIGAPVTTGPLVRVTTCRGGSASMSVDAGGGATVSYQWQRSTALGSGVYVDLSEGPMVGSAAVVSGATGRTLTIATMDAAAALDYRCVLTNSCGTETTNAARMALCAADFNCSGTLTVQDIFDFLGAWFSGTTAADFNASGDATVQDIFDFLAAWFAGC